jgi:hypothetical protein
VILTIHFSGSALLCDFERGDLRDEAGPYHSLSRRLPRPEAQQVLQNPGCRNASLRNLRWKTLIGPCANLRLAFVGDRPGKHDLAKNVWAISD